MNKSIHVKTAVQSTALAILLSNSISILATNESMIITANQMQQNINDTLTDVEIIDRQAIEKIQPQSFIDLLVNIAGIDVVQKGGQGQDASIFSRGSNSNQMLILIDGIRVGSATLGIKSVTNISIAQIERIEIVKGPRAALWGSDAIGGVIQIFTRRYQSGEHRVAVTSGSFGTREVDASIGFGNETISNTLTYSNKKTDGFDARIDAEDDADGYENNSFALRGDYKLSQNSTLDWLAQIDEGEAEFDTSWGGNIISHNNYHWNVRYSQQLSDWNNQFSASSSRDQSFTFGNGVAKADASIFETRRQQYNFLTRKNISDVLSVGGGIDWLEDNVEKSTTVYADTKRNTSSVFVNTIYNDNALMGEFAIRYDDVENVTSDTTFNLGLGYRFNQQHQLSLNIGEGFRAPSFNDLYFPFGGNPDLKFETSSNTELVYKGFYDTGNLVVSVYDSSIDNLIQWIPDNNGIWAPQNIGKADISGIDVSYKISYGKMAHKITASSVKAEDASTGMQLQLRAKRHFGYELSYTGNQFDLFTQLQYVGERPDTDFQTWMPTMLNSYSQLNIGASYHFDKQWQLKFKITDAFDESATLVSGYNAAGRQFYLTLVYQNLL